MKIAVLLNPIAALVLALIVFALLVAVIAAVWWVAFLVFGWLFFIYYVINVARGKKGTWSRN